MTPVCVVSLVPGTVVVACCPRKGAIVLSFLSKSINTRPDRDENTAKVLGELTRLESGCGIAYDTLCEET